MPATWRLAALACLLVAVSAQAQHRNSKSHSDDRDRDHNDVEFRLDTTVALGRSGTVDLQTFTGDITIVSWDRDEVKIHARSRGNVRFESSSSRVALVENPYRHDGYDDDDDDDNGHGLGFEISVPKNARLLLRTLSGDVKLRDVSDVEAHSVSGDIDAMNIATHAVLETVSGDLTAIKVGGGLRANTVSGDMKARQITGEVSAQSVSGDIVLEDVTSAYVRGETVSGEMQFSGPVDPKGRYEFHSHSGDVDLDLTGGGGNATLEVETYSGDLDAGCSLTMQPGTRGERMGKRGTFTMGNGSGAHFILKTFSGDVHITGCRSHGDK
ncbi:MAG TPA: DUF4097 family beta strand repeat-containing protein [Kofleriaceae bacterium]|nr:DUF4097 family beta strand repeat-containing protein [Kofleriaceae bacterium]